MRTVILLILTVFLAACNSSDDDSSLVTKAQLAASESTQMAALQARVASLEAARKELQLIGTPIGTSSQVGSIRDFRMLGEPTLAPAAVTVTGQFGPCPNMGVLQGRGGSDTANPLASQFEVYKNCTNTTYSISNLTGHLDVPPYLAWDGPNCAGNAYLEMDVPQNTMNVDAVKSGLSFQSPLPNDPTVYYVNSTQNPPQSIFIQSAINSRPGSVGCSVDQEMRLVTLAIPNNTQTNGVPNSMTPGSWTTVSP